MSQSKVLTAILPVVETLERLGIDYYIGGAIASLAHGIYRTTADVDIIAEIQLDQVSAFVQSLQQSYYVDADMVKDAIRHRSEFNVIHLDTMFKVDIFLPKRRPFDQIIRQRARKGEYTILEERAVLTMESAEDVILSKLEWYKLGGEISERQWGDILGILKVQEHNVDVTYLRHWAAENSMLVEAFFSTVASSVLTEIIKEIIQRLTNSKKPLQEQDIVEIVDRVLRKYPSLGKSSVLEREIIVVLGNAGLVGSGGQVLLSAPHKLPHLPELLGAWWDSRVYKIVSVASEKAFARRSD